MSLRSTILVTVLAAVQAGWAQVGPPPSQPAGDIAPADSPEALLKHPEVQRELKLSNEQLQAIQHVTRAVHDKYQRGVDKLRSLGPEERRRKQAELAKAISQEITSALGRVLQADQTRRLEQIELQQQGLRAFPDPRVEKALRLTGDQKDKLKMITEGAAREARMLFRTGTSSSFEETLKKVESVRKKAVEKSIAVLTEEQRKAWYELIGEPFAVKSVPPLIRPVDQDRDKPTERKPEASSRERP